MNTIKFRTPQGEPLRVRVTQSKNAIWPRTITMKGVTVAQVNRALIRAGYSRKS